jgi:hypothetical protein
MVLVLTPTGASHSTDATHTTKLHTTLNLDIGSNGAATQALPYVRQRILARSKPIHLKFVMQQGLFVVITMAALLFNLKKM